MNRSLFVTLALLISVLLAGCVGESVPDMKPSETEQSWELSNNPMFQELYTGITTITVTDQYTNEVICRIEDPAVIEKLLYTFNDWSLDSAFTTPRDIICAYLVSFDDQLIIEINESDTYCRIDHKSYILPEAFHQQIVENLS